MFKLKPTDISVLGSGMQRPECVLATKSGDLFCSNSRGGYNIVKPDGAGQFIKARGAPDDFMPNGIALLPNRDVLAANLAESSGVWLIKPDGEARLFLSEIDGVQLPPPNFVGLDSKSRIWITVSTRVSPRGASFKKGFADGFVAVHDDRGTRIVAGNIGYTNEGIVDPSGQWFYVNETVAQRTRAMRSRKMPRLGLVKRLLSIRQQHTPMVSPSIRKAGSGWYQLRVIASFMLIGMDGRTSLSRTLILQKWSGSRRPLMMVRLTVK